MLSRKDRKALASLDKQNAKRLEEETRQLKHVEMRRGMSIKLLESFENDRRLKLPSGFPVAVRISVPLWDCKLLLEDAQHLMNKFPSAVQYGGLHDGMWSTLCLRSMDGSTNNDCASDQYYETSAWSESQYIVPHLLSLLTAAAVIPKEVESVGSTYSLFQRVRLSIIPPNCNVAWHVDYENTQRDGPIRMHIPIQCSDQFVLCIGGQNVVMKEGETWLGQFELPHRLCNQNAGTMRIHLVVDMFPQRKPLTLTKVTYESDLFQESGASLETTSGSDAPVAPSASAILSPQLILLQLTEEAPLIVVDLAADIPATALDHLIVVPAVPVDNAAIVPAAFLVPVVPAVSVVPVPLVSIVPLASIADVTNGTSELFLNPEIEAGSAAVPVLLGFEPALESVLDVVVVQEETVVVVEVPVDIDIKGVQELLGELDWEPLRRSEFGRAVEQAFHRLYSYPYQSPPACADSHSSERQKCKLGDGADELVPSAGEAQVGEDGNAGACEEEKDTRLTSDDIGSAAPGQVEECDVASTIAQCVAAFSDYRWGGPFASTTEARAAVEASYYLKG